MLCGKRDAGKREKLGTYGSGSQSLFGFFDILLRVPVPRAAATHPTKDLVRHIFSWKERDENCCWDDKLGLMRRAVVRIKIDEIASSSER